MESAIVVIHGVIAVFLIAAIMLQAGKGADIGAAFGAGSSQTVFGPRGAATLLHKITIATALLFLVTSLALAQMSQRDAGSVLDSVPPSLQESDVLPIPVEGQDKGEEGVTGATGATGTTGSAEAKPAEPAAQDKTPSK